MIDLLNNPLSISLCCFLFSIALYSSFGPYRNPLLFELYFINELIQIITSYLVPIKRGAKQQRKKILEENKTNSKQFL